MGEAKRVFLVILVIEGRMRFEIEMVTEMIEAKRVRWETGVGGGDVDGLMRICSDSLIQGRDGGWREMSLDMADSVFRVIRGIEGR